jgi:hypothetical protein
MQQIIKNINLKGVKMNSKYFKVKNIIFFLSIIIHNTDHTSSQKSVKTIEISELFNSVDHKDIHILEELLKNGANPNSMYRTSTSTI